MTTSTVTSPETATTEVHSAKIIQFPLLKRAEPISPADRLTLSLAKLNAALQEQRAAVTAWRTVMGELKITTAGLHDSLQRYNTSLGTLGESVSRLRDRARSLEQWADKAETAKR